MNGSAGKNIAMVNLTTTYELLSITASQHCTLQKMTYRQFSHNIVTRFFKADFCGIRKIDHSA